VIRFNCPHCSRRYEVPEALARLALTCKGCGKPLTVPETSPEPEPQPEPAKPALREEPPKVVVPPLPIAPPAPRPSLAPLPKPAPVAVATENRLPPPDKLSTNGPPNGQTKNNTPDDESDFLFEKPDVLAEFEGPDERPPVAMPGLMSTPAAAPVAPTSAPRPPRDRKALGVAVDVAAELALLVIGVFGGELMAQQSTREVLSDAGSAAKFPPVALLMWMAPPLLFLLIYALLISRGKSLGAWLRGRGEPA
jgi:hypothetical protein